MLKNREVIFSFSLIIAVIAAIVFFMTTNIRLANKLEDSQEEAISMDMQIRMLRTKLKELNIYIDDRSEQFQKADLLRKLTRELNRSQDQVEDLSDEVKRLRDRKAEREKRDAVKRRLAETLDELKQSKQQLQQAQETIDNLQNNKIGELQEELESVRQELRDRSETVNMLSQNITVLRNELAAKEKEKQLFEERMVNAEAELSQKNSHYGELSILYDNLKGQMLSLSEVLTGKELIISKAQKENADLRQQVSQLETRLAGLQKDLSDTQNRQAQTKEELSALLNLNGQLQKKIVSAANSLASAEELKQIRSEADELKRKVEVFLQENE